MGYEKIQDLSTDTVFKLGGQDPKTGKPCPTQIEGYYLGNRAVQTSAGNAVIHVFQTPKGNEGIWGSKKLNDNLTRNIVGCMTLVVYKGKKKLTGGKTQHEYDMSVDKSNRIEVSSDIPNTYAEDEEDTTEYESSGAYEEDTAALLAQQAEQKAKVEALLKNRNVKKN
jgi:hypothetical protein